jgi:hypothetical protein
MVGAVGPAHPPEALLLARWGLWEGNESVSMLSHLKNAHAALLNNHFNLLITYKLLILRPLG